MAFFVIDGRVFFFVGDRHRHFLFMLGHSMHRCMKVAEVENMGECL